MLPFHQMGRYKWKRLGLDYTLEAVEPPTSKLSSDRARRRDLPRRGISEARSGARGRRCSEAPHRSRSWRSASSSMPAAWHRLCAGCAAARESLRFWRWTWFFVCRRLDDPPASRRNHRLGALLLLEGRDSRPAVGPFYFSAVTYTTTGYGDLVLPGSGGSWAASRH